MSVKLKDCKNSVLVKIMREELLKGLTEEQVSKLKACKSHEEMLELAKEEGVELNEEQLEAINGGACNSADVPCPKCGSWDTIITYDFHEGDIYYCNKCYHSWPR